MRYRGEEEEVCRQAALHALGILNRHESEIFETRLREGCGSATRALEEYRSVVRTLNHSSPESAPPAYLKDLVLARIAKEGGAPAPSRERGSPASVKPGRSPRPAPRRLGSSTAWVVAVVALVAAGYLFYVWQETERSLQTESFRSALLDSEARKLQSELLEVSARLDVLEELRRTAGDPDSRVIRLEGEPNGDGGEIFWNPEANRWIVSARLREPPPDEHFVIWYLSGSQSPRAAATLEVHSDGRVLQTIDLGEGRPALTEVAVTLEKSSAPEEPSTPFLLRGSPD